MKSLNNNKMLKLDEVAMTSIKGGGFVCPQCTGRKQINSASLIAPESEKAIPEGP